MKKLSLVLVFLVILESLCVAGIPAFATEVTLQGSGTAESPYLIGTEAELIAFRGKVNEGETTAYAKLTADIELTSKWETPIGTDANKYSGIFDGNDCTISGIYGSGGQWGFFKYTNGGEIKNLTLKAGNNGTINAYHQSALFVAIAENNTKITKCAGYGNITTSDGYIGGITCQGACIVTDCYYVGDITGKDWVTGMGYGAVATNCFVYGTIKATATAFKVANGSGTDATKNFYLSIESPGVYGYGTQKSESAFKGGEVAYLLGDAYGQTIGVDEHPVFRTDDNTVYFKDNISYTNDNTEDGTAEKPYTMTCEASLIAFRTAVNEGRININAKLVSDVELTSKWTGIGTETYKYAGVFDGNGYEISNIIGSGGSWGFFSYADGATIKNLTIKTAEDGTGDLGNQSALFVARGSDDTEITNCAGYGKVYSSWAWVGGISYDGACKVNNCYFIGDVVGVHNVTAMGIDAVATNCFIYGTVTAAETNAFRISNNSATTNCYFLNTVAAGDIGGYGTQMSADAFASGEVAYLINKGAGEVVCKQTIETDAYPIFDSENVVYKKLDGTYSNTEGTFVGIKNGKATIISTTDAVALVVQFKSDGMMEKVEPVTLNAGVEANQPVTQNGNAEYAKILIWNSLTELKPVSDAEEFNF